jgi:hypothetical protein
VKRNDDGTLHSGSQQAVRRVAVAWSSVGVGWPSKLVSGPAREGWQGGDSITCNEEGSWMAVDLGAGRRMEVTGYALRHGGHPSSFQLRSWELQGSAAAEGAEWVTLDRRQGDDTLPENGDAAPHYDAGYWRVNQAVWRQLAEWCGRCGSCRRGGTAAEVFPIACAAAGCLELYGVLWSDNETLQYMYVM